MDSGNSSEKGDKLKVKLDMSIALATAGSQNMATAKSAKIFPSMPLTFAETARDSSLMDFLEDNSCEAMPESPGFQSDLSPSSQNKSVAGDDGLLCLSFPKKLWKIVESEEYKSIRWNDNGDVVIIEEDFFKVEILERSGPFRIFETDSMKSFIRQLNLYGFSKIRQNQKSISVSSQSGKHRPSTRTKFYHNPNFRRDYPYLVQRMKRRVGIKSSTVECGSVQLDSATAGTKRRKSSATKEFISRLDSSNQPSLSQPSFTKEKKQKPIQKKPATEVSTRMNHAYPVSPACPQESNSCTEHSLANCTPSSLSDHSMDFCATNCAYQYPTASGVAFEHMMGLQQLHSTCPHFASINAQLTTMMSFFNPWLSMSLLAAASSVHMTASAHQHLPQSGQFCSTCTCNTGNETPANYDLLVSESPETP
ncbi:heat shock transcription factor, Y-linked-like [Ambystoma mexicanum]|uniref:heat shock transcription factor, Y-linked-like n=1 Tax=Ambystoma mexicanum TaxID=8296 RepID=UPI0037E859B3